MSVKKIFIITTFECNLRCKYCYEYNKTKVRLDVKKMQSILQSEFASSRKFDLYSITLHGGEPFLAFEEIKELCEWVWKNFTHCNVVFTATTNGTILNEEIKKWLYKNRHRFFIILSLDGKKEDHNVNRANSYDKIDLDFFLNTYNRPWAKMTVMPNTLERLYDNFLYLQNQGFRVNATLACETYWDKKIHLPIIFSELKKVVDYYICNENEVPGDLLSLPISRFLTHKNNFSTRCSLGSANVAYDVYGNRFPCQNFISDFSKPYNSKEIEECYRLIEMDDYRKITKDCISCPIKEVCSPCYGLNYSNRKDMGAIDKVWCDITKNLVYLNAYLVIKALLADKEYVWLKNKNKKEIASMALAAKYIVSIKDELI